MFINVLGLIKVLPLDFLISDHTRSEISMFFFSKWTVSTVKGSIFTTIVRRQGGHAIIQIRDKRIPWLTENVSNTRYRI